MSVFAPPPKEYLHVAIAADQRYELGLVATVHSLLTHSTHAIFLHLIVPAQGLSPRTKQWLHDRCSSCGASLAFHTVGQSFGAAYQCPQSHLTVATLYRLLLPDLMPDIDLVLYMDSDVVVGDDVADIWKTDLNNTALAAVRDYWFPTMGIASNGNDGRRALGFQGDASYFNAGTMLADLAWWRKNNVTKRSLDLLWANGSRMDMADQDALNLTLDGQWTELNPRWNVQVAALRRICEFEHAYQRKVHEQAATLRDKPGIVHFTGPFKPWNPPAGLRNLCRARFSRTLRTSGYLTTAEHMRRALNHVTTLAKVAAKRSLGVKA